MEIEKEKFTIINLNDQYITRTFHEYELNLDKVTSLEDCKKILKFLCGLQLKPIQDGLCYNGFGDVEEYFTSTTL